MASTATITPTLGSAPVTLQAGNYSAIDDRRFWSSAAREGSISGGSYQVIQRAAGANMTVDVTSSTGSGAIVQGDSVTAQGNYFVPPTAANVNVDIAAADATNPRNDLVVLEVKDDQHDAGGLNLARVRVITGTANASAALTDAPGANGTPALPSTCYLLAVVRVAAAASSILTAAISDRRQWAGGLPTYETSLPSPAVDGQEIQYRADSTNGVIWHLRFRNAFNGGSATLPWEFVGGSSLYATSGTTSTATTTYAGTVVSITVPLRGDYIIYPHAAYYNSTANDYGWISFSVGGTAASDADASVIQAFATSKYILIGRPVKKTDIAASSAIVNKYKVSSGNGSWDYQSLTITPIRVGT